MVSSIVFIALIIATCLGIAVPLLLICYCYFARGVKMTAVLKGMLIYLAWKLCFYPLILSFITQIVSSAISGFPSLVIIMAFFSFAEAVVQYQIFKQILNIRREPQQRAAYALGFGGMSALTIGFQCLQYLIIADHIRINDFAFLLDMGIDQSMTASIAAMLEQSSGFLFLAIGFQAVLILIAMQILVEKYYDCMEHMNKRRLLESYLLIFIINTLMNLGMLLPEMVYLFIVVCVILSTMLYYRKGRLSNTAVQENWKRNRAGYVE